MKNGTAVIFILAGCIAMLLSIATSTALLHDAHMPIPMAIIGAGLFIGGCLLAGKGK